MSPSSVRLRVPATTANLGPGYDVLGLALQVYNHFTVRCAEVYSMEITGPRASSFGAIPEDNLMTRAVSRLCQEVDRTLPALAITQEVDVPPARGMGSSSTAIVAGLMGANALLDFPLEKSQLVDLATEIEGHPDNVTPSLLGGLILCLPDAETGVRELSLPVPEDLCFGVCIPSFELTTQAARAALPKTLPYESVVANIAYQGSLIAGFCQGRQDWLKAGLRDRVHQPFRQTLVPGMQDVMQAAEAAGALGCVLSGAGPTLLAIWDKESSDPGVSMLQAWKKAGIDAEFVSCLIDRQGALCLDCH